MKDFTLGLALKQRWKATRKLPIKIDFSNSLIIHEAKTKETPSVTGFGNVIQPLYKLAKLSPSFSPEVRICLRSRI